jgi:hypothetical protein
MFIAEPVSLEAKHIPQLYLLLKAHGVLRMRIGCRNHNWLGCALYSKPGYYRLTKHRAVGDTMGNGMWQRREVESEVIHLAPHTIFMHFACLNEGSIMHAKRLA